MFGSHSNVVFFFFFRIFCERLYFLESGFTPVHVMGSNSNQAKCVDPESCYQIYMVMRWFSIFIAKQFLKSRVCLAGFRIEKSYT